MFLYFAEFVQEVNLTVIIISLAICLFGIFGNSIAIFVIVVLKEYQKSITNWYVSALFRRHRTFNNIFRAKKVPIECS